MTTSSYDFNDNFRPAWQRTPAQQRVNTPPWQRVSIQEFPDGTTIIKEAKKELTKEELKGEVKYTPRGDFLLRSYDLKTPPQDEYPHATIPYDSNGQVIYDSQAGKLPHYSTAKKQAGSHTPGIYRLTHWLDGDPDVAPRKLSDEKKLGFFSRLFSALTGSQANLQPKTALDTRKLQEVRKQQEKQAKKEQELIRQAQKVELQRQARAAKEAEIARRKAEADRQAAEELRRKLESEKQKAEAVRLEEAKQKAAVMLEQERRAAEEKRLAEQRSIASHQAISYANSIDINKIMHQQEQINHFMSTFNPNIVSSNLPLQEVNPNVTRMMQEIRSNDAWIHQTIPIVNDTIKAFQQPMTYKMQDYTFTMPPMLPPTMPIINIPTFGKK